MSEPTGYAHPLYAASLSDLGSPRELPRARGWILERRIPGSEARDAMSCYPLLALGDWSQLARDLDEIGSDIVSLVVVTDPFGSYDEADLRGGFPDCVVRYKEHEVVDLAHTPPDWVASHHRRNARRALARVRVEVVADPATALPEWVQLYDVLVARHRIRGVAAFSRIAFDRQLRTPGLTAMRAVHDGATVGMILWYVRGDIAYYHLGAYTPAGYAVLASFALFDFAIRHFATSGLRWLDLGAGAGLAAGSEGLRRFKQGWANTTRPVYLCGRIYDPDRYDRLVHATGPQALGSRYFPAYRTGEER